MASADLRRHEISGTPQDVHDVQTIGQPISDSVELNQYIQLIYEDMSHISGVAEVLQSVKNWSEKEKITHANAFAEKLSRVAEKSQRLRDELGIDEGMYMLQKRMYALLSTHFSRTDFRFATGIREEDFDQGGMGAMFKYAARGKAGVAKRMLEDYEIHRYRFINEQTALQLLTKSEIAPQFEGVVVINDKGEIVDDDDPEGRRHILMEWIDGETLASLVKLYGPLSPKKAYGIIASIAAAEENLVNNYSIFHRDINHRNVMVNRHTGEVKIIDFGLMKLKPKKNQKLPKNDYIKSQEGMPMGTPGFMSRQQFENAALLDERNESFLIGSTAYYLLTGKTAVPPGEGLMRYVDWDGEVDMSPVPEEAREWLGQLLHKDIEQRTLLNEAGKFPFEHSEHAQKFGGSWEKFLKVNHARRTIDPDVLFQANDSLSKQSHADSKLTEPFSHPDVNVKSGKIFNLWNGIIAGVGVATITGASFLFMGKGNDDVKPVEKEKENPVPVQVQPDPKDKEKTLKKSREKKNRVPNPFHPAEFTMNKDGLWESRFNILAANTTPESPKWPHVIHVPAEYGVQLLGKDKKSRGRIYQLPIEDCFLLQGIKPEAKDQLYHVFKNGLGSLVYEYHFISEDGKTVESSIKLGGIGEFEAGGKTLHINQPEVANFAIAKSFQDLVDWPQRISSDEFRDFWEDREIPDLDFKSAAKDKKRFFPRAPIHNLFDNYKINANEHIKMVRKLSNRASLEGKGLPAFLNNESNFFGPISMHPMLDTRKNVELALAQGARK